MRFLKSFCVVVFTSALCNTQAISISGTVKENGGKGIEGAIVTLESADISTTTGADGQFTLSSTQNLIHDNGTYATEGPNTITLHNNTINITAKNRSSLVILVYTINGRCVGKIRQDIDVGSHDIGLPMFNSGTYLYQISFGVSTYYFRGITCGKTVTLSMKQSPEARPISGLLSKKAKYKAAIDDMLAISKEGYLKHRTIITNYEQSGIEITLFPNAGNVTDADGNVYQSIQIGTQIWTVENLRTTKYNDNTSIPLVADNTEWEELSTPAYCFYNNSTDTIAQQKWGALYNWFVVNTGKLAPEGWHVPNIEEWNTLQHYLSNNGYIYNGTSGNSDKIAKSLAAQSDWKLSSRLGAIGNDLSKNNTSGFSALPSGYRHSSNGNFQKINEYSNWWSSTEGNVLSGAYRSLNYGSNNIYGSSSGTKKCGYSVRLVRDAVIEDR